MRSTLAMAAALGMLTLSLRAEDRAPVVSMEFEGNLVNEGSVPFEVTPHGDGIKFKPVDGGQVLFIGGTEDWVDVAVDERLSFEKGATLEFVFARADWENPYKGGSGWQTLAAVDGLCLNITAPGCPLHKPWALEGTAGSYTTNRGSAVTRSDPGLIQPDQWYHVALAYDAAGRTATLYLNGKQIDSKEKVSPTVGKRVNPLRIGTWYKANQAFRGWIDNLHLYDYPRSAVQIREANRL